MQVKFGCTNYFFPISSPRRHTNCLSVESSRPIYFHALMCARINKQLANQLCRVRTYHVLWYEPSRRSVNTLKNVSKQWNASPIDDYCWFSYDLSLLSEQTYENTSIMLYFYMFFLVLKYLNQMLIVSAKTRFNKKIRWAFSLFDNA